MRRFLFVISAAAACGMVACERKAANDSADEKKRQEQREADERRIAELRALEQRAADREAAAAAAELDKQRQDLAEERAKLEADRAALSEEQKRAADARLERIREQEEENERRAELRRAEQRKRDQHLAEERAASERAEQNLDFFYDALDPEGDWIEVERFGYCWQPNVARRGDWRPYVDGHWAYTNYGWTWVSQEPFGWATYHYGRWIRLRRHGWVWVPGSEWAPAWVSWRRSDRHIGWAPLPPEAHSTSGFTAAVESRYDIGPGSYNFVAIENFGQPSYVKEVLQPEQNFTIVQQTVNVTNITYQNVDNRVVVRNEGPQFAEISKRANLRRLAVERVAQAPRPAEERGDTLRIVAPVVAPSAKETRPPKRVKENVKAPDIERGWTGASAAAVSEVREQQKQEARKAEESRTSTRPPIPPQKAESPKAAPPKASPLSPAEPFKPGEKPGEALPPKARPEAPPSKPPASIEKPSVPTKSAPTPAPKPERLTPKPTEYIKPSPAPDSRVPAPEKPAPKPGEGKPAPGAEIPVPEKPGRAPLKPSAEQPTKPTPATPSADFNPPTAPTKPFMPPTGKPQPGVNTDLPMSDQPKPGVEIAPPNRVKEQGVRPAPGRAPVNPPADATGELDAEPTESGPAKKPGAELKQFRETNPAPGALPETGLRPTRNASAQRPPTAPNAAERATSTPTNAQKENPRKMKPAAE